MMTPQSADFRVQPQSSLVLDALVVFLGAFLLFQIQPIYSKSILPWFGGAPLVWATALVFFQTTLLTGYAYAHFLIARIQPTVQIAIHGVLLGLSLLFVPVEPSASWKPVGESTPSWDILAMLVCTLGLPYFLLSSTSPLLQAWIARYRYRIVPYRMFSLSNLASLLGLLSYPFLIEPLIGLQLQFSLWAWGYRIYVGMMAALLFVTFRALRKSSPAAFTESLREQPAEASPPTTRRQFFWIALSTVPSILLLAITQHLTLDVAPVPFLWVLPLVLYLLTFVICFEYPRFVPRRAAGFVAVASGCVMIFLIAAPHIVRNFWLDIAVSCLCMFFSALYCHAELYARRPAPLHLTRFYLMTAIGGALGGVFVGLIAHHLFTGYQETFVGFAGCAILVFYTEWLRSVALSPGPFQLRVGAVFPLFGLVLALAVPINGAFKPEIRAVRNFFGALRVHRTPAYDDVAESISLSHGSTKHGMQFLPGPQRCTPTSYFSEISGAGRLLRTLSVQRPSLNVGLVGLGVGTLAAYARPADRYVFYEINPLVEDIARNNFTFLSECSSGAEVRLGDARVRLESEPSNGYDVLLIDAFSGDSIPVHLLTREAFQIYASHLAGGGVIAVNISNRYLDLRPVVRASGEAVGFDTRFVIALSDPPKGSFESQWAILARDSAVFDAPLLREAITQTAQTSKTILWTDDFSNLFSVLGTD